MALILDPLYSEPGHHGYGYRSFTLAHYEHLPTADDFRVMREAYRTVAAREGRLCSVTLLDCQMKMALDEETRRISNETTAEFVDVTDGGAVVLTMTGLKGSFFRTVISGINLVARNSKPFEVFRDWEPAVRWLVELEGQPDYLRGSASALVDALRPKLGELKTA